MGSEKVSHTVCGNFNMQEHNWPQLYKVPGGEYKALREAAMGLAVAWCSNPVSGMTSA